MPSLLLHVAGVINVASFAAVTCVPAVAGIPAAACVSDIAGVPGSTWLHLCTTCWLGTIQEANADFLYILLKIKIKEIHI